ncbi:MAG: hypothetical protein IPG51_04730 [Chloroflexi bacterium]|nr:hypothetical protein [Chloroflexota bacterium]
MPGSLPLVYVLAGAWLEKRRGHERTFTRPFYHMALFVSLPAMLFSLGQAIGDWGDPGHGLVGADAGAWPPPPPVMPG